MPRVSTKRLMITGRVHGVGYRAWAQQEATRLGLSGWVRNRRDGSVEMIVDGESDAVEEMLRACRRGPRHADVASVEEELAEAPERLGFDLMPTV
jgi:acylphosphatase